MFSRPGFAFFGRAGKRSKDRDGCRDGGLFIFRRLMCGTAPKGEAHSLFSSGRLKKDVAILSNPFETCYAFSTPK